MSFIPTIGHVIAVSKLCWTVYRACRDAAGNYKDVAGELESLHINLKNVVDAVEDPKSLLNRRGETLRDEFDHILSNIQKSLKELETMITKYRSLGSKEKRVWERIRFGFKELNVLRNKLHYHTNQIKLFLSNIMVGSMGRIESILEEIVQEIRSGKRPPTVLSIESGGEKAALGW